MDGSAGSSLNATMLVVVASYALFVIACGTIGVRLLALANRTRQLPEFLLGFGLSCFVLALPMLGIAGLGRGNAGDFNGPLGALALLLTWSGIVSMVSFTWRTFRVDSKWALGFVLLISAFEAFVCLACFSAITRADPASIAFDATSRWILLLRAPVGVMFFWTGLEAFLAHRMARRREALGLADRVITNRMFLWYLVGFVSCGNNVIATVLHAQGKSPTSDPLAAMVMAFGGLAGALLLYLAFLPPDRYLRFIRQRGEVGAAAA